MKFGRFVNQSTFTVDKLREAMAKPANLASARRRLPSFGAIGIEAAQAFAHAMLFLKQPLANIFFGYCADIVNNTHVFVLHTYGRFAPQVDARWRIHVEALPALAHTQFFIAICWQIACLQAVATDSAQFGNIFGLA